MTARRDFLKLATASTAAALAPQAQSASGGTGAGSAGGNAPGTRWISTTQRAPWRRMQGVRVGPLPSAMFAYQVEILPDKPLQTMRGFGGAFSEKGWLALRALPAAAREAALDALFAPGQGASLNLGRTPVGGNDIARGWYSYDETDGDFALAHFSIDNDRDTLIPFIQAALKRRPDMGLWASPWSPPVWMKTNGHYAMAPAWPGQPSNGIRPEQIGREGKDHFRLEPAYLEAYARYFKLYVEAYAREGIRIGHVMPQNEFNSAQPFPSCCWTPEGLARFIPYLAREVGPLGVEIFFGTLERGNPGMLDAVLKDPAAGPLVRGVGLQWAGHEAVKAIHERHPGLEIWQSEQECGFGTNDWHYARYIWGRMKEYFGAGANAWFYWNLVMPTPSVSTWGWPQNSLVAVDAASGRFTLTHEYYLLAHLSHFVAAGARRIDTQSFMGYENQLAFRNPNGEVVVIIQNEMSEPLDVGMKLGNQRVSVTLPADSFNTLVLPAA
ncbi:MAG: hypothetical protein RLZZ200_2981 [Pseudomonadota bacterium]|jgi:glucosylceramidase